LVFLLTLSATAGLGWEAALAWIDDRSGYGGVRMVALTPNGAILYFEAIADRVTATNVISLRKASRREVCHYVKAIQEDQPVIADN
jgi:uncharacterized DUF497 family protein